MTPPTPAVCGDWTDCYAEGWRGIITPESFAHPAKMARGLLRRILEHARDEGWIEPGGLICDPFGGVGTTGILGADFGYRVVCHELEPRFVELARQNFALHARRWETWKRPLPVMLCGDSRRLSESLASAGLVVSSPPFQDGVATGDPNFLTPGEQGKRVPSKSNLADYGTTQGQLGAMKVGDVAVVIGSPPFAGDSNLAFHDDSFVRVDNRPGRQGTAWHKKPIAETTSGDGASDGYGTTPGQLGAMKAGDVAAVIGSPPFAGEQSGGGIAAHNGENGNVKTGTNCGYQNQGASPGQLARMIVGSPPYEGQQVRDNDVSHNSTERDKGRHGGRGFTDAQGGTFADPAQLSAQSPETFWSAAADILRECHQILRPVGHAIWVCKDFVRKGRRVPFSDDWLRLCEATGFQLVCRHRAMLTSSDNQPGLFGDGPRVKSRKSFFRRLCEAKGSPRIDWEDVLCLVKL